VLDGQDANPSPETPRGIDLKRLYEFRFRGVDQTSRQEAWNEIAPYLWNRMGRPTRLLDPAGGRGEFVNALPTTESWLVDIADYPGRVLASNVKLLLGDIFTVDLPREYFEGVFASNVLEHFPTPDSIASFLARMHQSLARNGVIAIMGPNYKYCANEYFDCADHVLALTHVAVEEHLFAAGFEPIEVIPRFLPYSFRSRLPSSPALVRAYLRSRPLWSLAGKQFLVLGRRT
jgi:hypothetical protein